MKKHGYIRVSTDSQLDRIESIAEALRATGLEISDTEAGKVVGQFKGIAEEEDIPRIRKTADSLGVRFVPADEDEQHELPPPDAELQ